MPRKGQLRVMGDVAHEAASDASPAARRRALSEWARNCPGASRAMRDFLCVLAKHADARGECYPHQSTIAAELRCKVRAVQYLVARARDRGWIEVVANARGKHSRGNVYRLMPSWAPSIFYPGAFTTTGGNVYCLMPSWAPVNPQLLRLSICQSCACPLPYMNLKVLTARAHEPPPLEPPRERGIDSPSGSRCREADSLRSSDGEAGPGLRKHREALAAMKEALRASTKERGSPHE